MQSRACALERLATLMLGERKLACTGTQGQLLRHVLGKAESGNLRSLRNLALDVFRRVLANSGVANCSCKAKSQGLDGKASSDDN